MLGRFGLLFNCFVRSLDNLSLVCQQSVMQTHKVSQLENSAGHLQDHTSFQHAVCSG